MKEIEYIERESVDNVLVDMLGDIENYEECSCEFTRGFEKALSCAEDKIKDIFAADVRPERHGKWILNFDNFTPANRCSKCKVNFPSIAGSAESVYSPNLMHYCPNCGARMDGDENDRAKIN